MFTSLSRPAAFRLLALLPLAAPSLSAQRIVRGPCLQPGTPTSVVVRWRTDVPTDTAVKFGLPTQGRAGGLMSVTEAYYSFDYGNIHCVCLNSQDTALPVAKTR